MSRFTIIELELFSNDFSKLEKVDQERVERLIIQLQENGDVLGKPLGLPFVREKKFNGNRLYFVVYKEWNHILLWGFSDKKVQNITIQKIKESLPELREYVRRKITIGFECDEASKDGFSPP